MQLSPDAYDFSTVTELEPTGKFRLRPAHPVVMMLKRVLESIMGLLELPPNPLDDLVRFASIFDVLPEGMDV